MESIFFNEHNKNQEQTTENAPHGLKSFNCPRTMKEISRSLQQLLAQQYEVGRSPNSNSTPFATVVLLTPKILMFKVKNVLERMDISVQFTPTRLGSRESCRG